MTGIEIPALSTPKVALVTGGGSGIGKATAARLAAIGCAVVVGYNSRRALAEEVIGGLQGGGHLAMRIAIDDPASIGLPKQAKGNVEGYLFPATYDFGPKANPKSMLTAMVDRWKQAAKETDLKKKAKTLGYSPAEVIPRNPAVYPALPESCARFRPRPL